MMAVPIHIPQTLLDDFCDYSEINTSKGIETLAYISGIKIDARYEVTHLIFPQQTGTKDLCDVTDDGAITIQNIIQNTSTTPLGWIHVHPQPSWGVDPTSVDLHNQYNMQKTNADSVGIIVSPTNRYGPKYGVFHLPPEGMTLIESCPLRGFHTHEGVQFRIHQTAHHCILQDMPRVKVLNCHPILKRSSTLSRPWQLFSYGNAPPLDPLHFPPLPAPISPQHLADVNIRQPRKRPHKPNSPHQPPKAAKESDATSHQETQPATNKPQKSEEVPFEVQHTSSHPAKPARHPLFEHEYIQLIKTSDMKSRSIKLLSDCSQYIDLERYCSAALAPSSTTPPEVCSLSRSLIDMENTFISVMTSGLSSSGCCISTFVVTNESDPGNSYLYTRYMDFGSLNHFVEQNAEVLEPHAPRTNNNIRWKVMTEEDFVKKQAAYSSTLEEKRSQSRDSTHRLPKSGLRWDRVVDGPKANKKSLKCVHEAVQQELNKVHPRIQAVGTYLYVEKSQRKLHLVKKDSVFSASSGIYAMDESIQNAIEKHFLHKTLSPSPVFRAMVDSHQQKHLSLHEQEKIINSLSNDVHGTSQGPVAHASYFSTGTDDEGFSRYRPTSIRNCVIYYLRHGLNDKVLQTLYPQEADEVGPSHTKARPCQSSARTNTPINLCSGKADTSHHMKMHDVDHEVTSDLSVHSSPLQVFHKELVGDEGVLKWRVHGTSIDIVSMNDIDLDAGNFCRNRFVHVSRRTLQSTVSYSCSCKMFIVTSQMIEPEVRCCHINFFHKHIEPLYARLFSAGKLQPRTRVEMKVVDSLAFMNLPVCRLDQDEKFHRFSILSGDHKSCSVVTLHENRVSCTFGYCRSQRGNTRKVRDIDDAANCQHIRALSANADQWAELLKESQQDDQDDKKEKQGNFDPSTGLWQFPSVSIHKPRDKDDPVFQEAFHRRASITKLSSGVGMDQDGFFLYRHGDTLRPFSLKPNLNREVLCKCRGPYWNEEYPDGILQERYRSPMNVYLESGVAKFSVFDRLCLNKCKECIIEYCGQQDSIHILSSATAAGDEVGWRFIETVTRAEMTLTAFCEIYSSMYVGSNLKFMSRQTFTEWIFSWLSNFKIDFRQLCVKCGPLPKVLACDGTKVGIMFKNASVIPIETPTNTSAVQPAHKRTQRQFFPYSDKDCPDFKADQRKARACLGYYVAKYSNELVDWEKVEKMAKVLKSCSEADKRSCVLSSIKEANLQAVLSRFIDFEYDHDVTKALCPVLRILASESPVTSLFHYRFLDILLGIIQDVSQTVALHSLRNEMPEIVNLLEVSIEKGATNTVFPFLTSIIHSARQLHAHDSDFSEAAEVIEEYNPETTGRAYYFTEHGGRLRDLSNYNISSTKEVDVDRCKKKFYEANKSGETYLFLWFDPLHGHCYGFHLITTSEGRKDPFASAFMYMKEPPNEVFYDFSCQLEEYCLNREPKFWRGCRFFHDIFHGYSHKCPYVYTSKRVPALEVGINSEICEQFNSYIQKIKSSAHAMNQSHYVFYLQFFIHLWNKKKRERCEKEQQMAQALFNL